MEQAWGRLLIAGGTDFAILGRKDKTGNKPSSAHPERPDLPAAQIMRWVANVKFKSVHMSHSSCHAVAISSSNEAYLFGRNEHYQLSYPLPEELTTSFLSTDGTPSPTPPASFPFPLKYLPEQNVPMNLRSQGIISAATGRGHTILVTEHGEAWSAGWNHFGQCGHDNEAHEHVTSFTRVLGDLRREKVVAASCGTTFSLFLCKSGRVYAVGTGEKGVLGNGRTGEHIAASKVLFTEQSEPLLVQGVLRGKQIVQIACGQQHAIALDEEGVAYAWGFGGLGRLGTGKQEDALSPVVIPAFAYPTETSRIVKIACGATNSMFIDGQGMVLLCGRWKTSGDGSAGQPWMTPKSVLDLQGMKWDQIAAGGVTLFANASNDQDGEVTVSWGQNAQNGELALGLDAPRSATKPSRIEPLDGVEIIDIAAGQATTLFIARPPAIKGADVDQKANKIDTPDTAEKTDEAESDPTPQASKALRPVVDLSGFGFSFGPPVPVAVVAPLASARAAKDTGASRTAQEKWDQIGRFPVVYDATDSCLVCGRFEGPEESLECEMCENAFHGACLSPPIEGIPEGEWFCPKCAPPAEKGSGGGGKKRKAEGDDGEFPHPHLKGRGQGEIDTASVVS
ncbi:BQ2448_549 [Microbotryum intermedium]|uniref:BQ2448_549 protein n=1 Tax=Microbotryum intermedium TaxID=269621 RepID=A0A238FBB2_9BASI|nr:BQ2448_549 [Microbotryum intermedium]